MRYLIATTGKTHSGKTTLGKKLETQIKDSCLLDSDILTDFLKKTYPKLYQDDLKDGGTPSEDYELKHNLTMALGNAADKKDINIIYTGASSTKEIRNQLQERATTNNKKLILIYLNLSDDILLKRIHNSKRKENNENHIKEFTDLLLNRQSIRYEKPTTDEADFFFEIKNKDDFKIVEQKIIKLVNG